MKLDLSKCNVCPRNCAVNRYNETGYCKATDKIALNLYQLHYGEEPNISGTKGSGTIFFSNCNTSCVYCQNFTISQFGWGREIKENDLADIMIELQNSGAHNINLVTPTHYTPQILETLETAKRKGLKLPIVWNSNAYESVETLKMLEGLVDIYLPDFRYYDRVSAKLYSEAENYMDIAPLAIKEMFRQVGHIKEEDGIVTKGLMIRLLILPGNVNRIDLVMKWIAENIGTETFVSLMGQYYPTFRTSAFPEINRPINKDEYDYAVQILTELGFENGFIQDMGSTDDWTPKFTENN